MNQEEVTIDQIRSLLKDPSSVEGFTFNNLSEFTLFLYRKFSSVYELLKSDQEYSRDQISERTKDDQDTIFHDIAEGYFNWATKIDGSLLRLSKLAYELWYEKALEWENKNGQRVHKGTQLHQIAWIEEQEGNFNRAYDFYVLAWLEDVLSKRSYSDGQGFRKLTYYFGLSSQKLKMISKIALESGENSLNVLLGEIRKNITIPTYQEIKDFDEKKITEFKNDWNTLYEEWTGRKSRQAKAQKEKEKEKRHGSKN